MMSIPISLVIFRRGLKIDYFCPLHLFVVIIIMGIGADDVFVFHDMWSHTRHIKIMRKRIPLRLAYTFRKASSAMLVTSITTAVSFLSTCISPIMPICSFGIFASIVITVNYFLILTVIPNIYIFYEKHIKKRFNCCSKIKSKVRPKKYDDMQEVQIPKNVDIEESLLQDQSKLRQCDLVNPSI